MTLKTLKAIPAMLSLLAASGGWAQLPPTFTSEDLLSLDRASDLQLSPDEKRIAFTIGTPDTKDNVIRSRIRILDVTAGRSTPAGDDIDGSNARWAADGRGFSCMKRSAMVSRRISIGRRPPPFRTCSVHAWPRMCVPSWTTGPCLTVAAP